MGLIFVDKRKRKNSKILVVCLAVLIMLTLVTPPSVPLKAENTGETKLLWKAKGLSIVAVHKLGVLVAKLNDTGDIKEIDFLNINTGKSLWDNPANDMTKIYANKKLYEANNQFSIYKNTVIVPDSSPSRCFDLFTGKKLWEIKGINLYRDEINQDESIIYTTYDKEYDSNVVDLLRFDLEKGVVLSSSKINLASTDAALKFGAIPYVIASKGDLIFFNFGYQIQCFDISKQRVVWKTDSIFYTGYCRIFNDEIIFWHYDLVDCESDSEYYDCCNIFTGELKYRLNGRSLHNRENVLFFYQIGCPHLGHFKEPGFLQKELPSLKTIKNITFPNKDYAGATYGSKYMAICTFSDKHGSKADLYDYDLNLVQNISIPFKQSVPSFATGIFDDIMILDTGYTKASNNSELAVYALPNYNKSNHTYKPPLGLISRLIGLILGWLIIP